MQAGAWQLMDTLQADPRGAMEHPPADNCSACGAPVQVAHLMHGFCNDCADQILYLARWQSAHHSPTRRRGLRAALRAIKGSEPPGGKPPGAR
jgi:hypothetical protein